MKMTGARVKTALVAVLVGGALMSYQNCSGPQGFRYKGHPGMMDDGKGGLFHSGGTTTDNPKPTLTLQVGNFQSVIANSSGPAPQIFLCVSEIRFEKATNGADDTRIKMDGTMQNPEGTDFLQGVADERKFIALRPEGTVINSIDVPVGNYQRIELRLRGDCGGVAAAVKNANGEILLREDADVRFSGSIVVNGDNVSRLVLNMDSMVAALANAKNSRDIEDALDDEGSCSGGDSND